MNDRPILFSGEMVRAILEGRKTQTRRVVKDQPFCCEAVTSIKHHDNPNCHNWLGLVNGATLGIVDIKCPYGVPGDRMWVKETFAHEDGWYDDGPSMAWKNYHGFRDNKPVATWIDYRATYDTDGNIDPNNTERDFPWTPSIFMPRWASRITLEIVSVRVERLQDISEEDAKAEGVTGALVSEEGVHCAYKTAYAVLWDEINGKGSWENNPWVWVIEFKKVEVVK